MAVAGWAGRVFLFVFIVGLAGWLSAQNESATPASSAAADKSSESNPTHDELRKLRDQLIQAINAKNVDNLLNLLHEDIVLTTQDGVKLVSVRKREGVREYINRLLIGPDAGVSSLQINPQVDELTILHGPSTGIAFGSSNDHYQLRDGSEFDLATRWSATVVKQGDQWLVANLQVSTNLFDNPITQSIRRFSTTATILAAGIGLFVGFLLSRFASRKPAS